MQLRLTRPRVAVACLGLVISSLPSRPALAVSDEERAGARAAATQGVEAFRQEHWAEA